MWNMFRPALVLAIVVCVSGEKLEDGREPKAIKKLNTFVVDPKSPDIASVAPVLKTAQLASETPQLHGSAADEPPQPDTKLSTKTIYGFLNFITTVGDTVMVFTPGAETAAGAESPQTADPGAPASVRPSPSRTAPPIATTASEPLPERHLRFTSTEPAPSTEQETAEPPTTSRRKGKNLLWAKLRGRTSKERRPFVLPQRRGLQTARSAAARPTPPLRRQFLSAAPPSVVLDTTPAAQSGTQTVDEPTHAAITLKTVQAGEEFNTEPRDLPTKDGVTHVSSVIKGSVTEFLQLPAPASEPEVLPIERLLTAEPEQQTAEEPDSRPPVQSLQERLKARLQAALESRPSRASAAGQRRQFTLVPEQRARSVRPVRPELPLSARRSQPARNRAGRRMSAADRLKQRLLKQRQQSAPAEEQQQPEEPAEQQQQQPTESQQKILAVNTYRPMDATGFYYELTTLKSLHLNTLGRFTNSHWLTSTQTRTVRVKPTATQRAPAVSATALPAGATLGLFGGLKPSGSSSSGGLAPGSGGKVVMLPAVQLDPSSPSLPLKTMRETYSTTQLLLKSSVIPLVIGDSTRTITLTQSYQVTRLVTALKTMPPMELFQTAAPPGLLHSERPLLAQGSENQVDELGVPVVRVPPPDDLAAIGLFDVDRHESEANPEEFQLQQQAAAAAAPTPTPALPPQLGMLGTLGQLGQLGALGQLAQLSQLTPQQLAYLQLLRPIFPALQQQQPQAGLPQAGLPQAALPQAAAPRSIVTSSPVVYSTVTTSVHSRAVVVTFRAIPSTAYITSTSVFPTVLTSYVTTTMQVQRPSPLG